jgi:hypothetical protein
LEQAGAFASDRAAGSTSFSLAEGANGGNASAPVRRCFLCGLTALIL